LLSEKPAAEDRARLARCAALCDLDPAILDRIFESTVLRRHTIGEEVIAQGDPGDCLLVLVEGRAKARVRRPDGESHEVGTFAPGDVFGEMALVNREPRSADVVAETDLRLLALAAEDFHEIARHHVELGMVLTRLIGERLGRAEHDGLGGKTLHGYRVLRCVGRGGMAMVYEAEQEATGRRVALKMMSHALLYDLQALGRFRQEADVVASLDHDNVAKLFERFPAFGTQFLALEYCDGPPLSLVAGRGVPLREERARPILGQIARGLAYVHERKIVHRDLKPANVMLTSRGVVKITDFGLARPGLEPGGVTSSLAHTLAGTPAYMAPEQLHGEPADARGDVYALGCIAWELVTGCGLFRATSLVDLIRHKQELALPAASEIGPRGVSAELHAFLESALAPDPAARPVSVAALAGWAGPAEVEAQPYRGRPLGEDEPTVEL
jgi:hypothetical protein